jgi:hypothetical protein
LVVLKSRLDVVVVGVKPLDHFQARNVNALLLVTTTHGKILVSLVKTVLCVSLGNSLMGNSSQSRVPSEVGGDGEGYTYAEILDVVEDMVVVCEVITGDDVDTSILLDLPVFKTKALGLGEEVLLGQLAAPVSFGGLLEVTELSHARESEDRGGNHLDCSFYGLDEI